MGHSGKFQNEAFLRKGDITSELPHVAIMEFLFMWMDILPDIGKMLKLNSSAIKATHLAIDLEYYEKYR